MAKSRVEKNKELYEEIELESFELEDLSEAPKKKEEKKENKKHEVVKVEKNEVVEVKEEPKEDDVVVEQPLSYTNKLSVEEILRAKLEKQQKLKDDKRVYKKTPVTETYTSEMMQKNINQAEGVDVRKEVNIRVKKSNAFIVIFLCMLLLLVVAGGAIAMYFLLKNN